MSIIPWLLLILLLALGAIWCAINARPLPALFPLITPSVLLLILVLVLVALLLPAMPLHRALW